MSMLPESPYVNRNFQNWASLFVVLLRFPKNQNRPLIVDILCLSYYHAISNISRSRYKLISRLHDFVRLVHTPLPPNKKQKYWYSLQAIAIGQICRPTQHKNTKSHLLTLMPNGPGFYSSRSLGGRIAPEQDRPVLQMAIMNNLPVFIFSCVIAPLWNYLHKKESESIATLNLVCHSYLSGPFCIIHSIDLFIAPGFNGLDQKLYGVLASGVFSTMSIDRAYWLVSPSLFREAIWTSAPTSALVRTCYLWFFHS